MVTLIRIEEQINTTLSKLFIADEFMCYALEDRIRQQKVYGRTCIPEGVYPLRVNKTSKMARNYRSRFGKVHEGMVEIHQVPGFLGIFFHIGNSHKDTKGCPLLGARFSIKDNDFYVFDSRRTYLRVYPRLLEIAESPHGIIEVVNHIKRPQVFTAKI